MAWPLGTPSDPTAAFNVATAFATVETVNRTVSQDKTAGLEAENERLLAAAFNRDTSNAELQNESGPNLYHGVQPRPAYNGPVYKQQTGHIDNSTARDARHLEEHYAQPQLFRMTPQQQQQEQYRQYQLQQRMAPKQMAPQPMMPPQQLMLPYQSQQQQQATQMGTSSQYTMPLKPQQPQPFEPLAPGSKTPEDPPSALTPTYQHPTSRQIVKYPTKSTTSRYTDKLRSEADADSCASMTGARKLTTRDRALSTCLTRNNGAETQPIHTIQLRQQVDAPTGSEGRQSDAQRAVVQHNSDSQIDITGGHPESLSDKSLARHRSKLPIRWATKNSSLGLTRPSSRPSKGTEKSQSSHAQHCNTTNFAAARNEVPDLPVREGDSFVLEDSPLRMDFNARDAQHTSLSSDLVSIRILTEHGIRFRQDPTHCGNILILDQLSPEELGILLHLSSQQSPDVKIDRGRVDEACSIPDHEFTGPGNASPQTESMLRITQPEQPGTQRQQSGMIEFNEVERPFVAKDIPESDLEYPCFDAAQMTPFGLSSSETPTRADEDLYSQTLEASRSGPLSQTSCDILQCPTSQIPVSPDPVVSIQRPAQVTTAEPESLALIESLLKENAKLRNELRAAGNTFSELDGDAKWLVAHRVFCHVANKPGSYATYLDTPVWVLDRESNHQHLDARRRIPNEGRWEDRQNAVPFIAYLEYHCADHPDNRNVSRGRIEKSQLATNCSETIGHRREELYIKSIELRARLEERMSSAEGLSTYLEDYFLENGRIKGPYLMYYHFKEILCQLPRSLSTTSESEYHALMGYFDARTARQSRLADEMIAKGKISREYIPYLFVPGEILLRRGTHGLYGVKQKSKAVSIEELGDQVNSEGSSRWVFETELIRFDGEFYSQINGVELTFPSNESIVDITSLDIYPLKSDDQSTREKLVKRGRLFLECRGSKYMGMTSDTDRTKQDIRCMVDAKTYKLVHPETSVQTYQNREQLLQYQGRQEDEDFLLCLPDSIKAFNMHEKAWHTVAVDCLKHVTWNTDAFNSLAIDEKTKTLLEALVTNKIEADSGTDVVAGKGTGLIVLLHGGPGTGKTLTAESVAEFAKKPLYRITCGDVGTNPKEVERYLESAFQLGRTWDCVVLLDEADVFLEQRSFQNLERNALVSVFLRVLEYYDGILLLTSNRVGTFDEAFKSRIQLALHYDSLDEDQREQIWTNFINRLEHLEVAADYVGIRNNIRALAQRDMNGRQIRNAITTARQLAKHERIPVKYEHLVDVIKVSSKFEEYLLEVKDNVTDAEEKRDGGIR